MFIFGYVMWLTSFYYNVTVSVLSLKYLHSQNIHMAQIKYKSLTLDHRVTSWSAPGYLILSFRFMCLLAPFAPRNIVWLCKVSRVIVLCQWKELQGVTRAAECFSIFKNLRKSHLYREHLLSWWSVLNHTYSFIWISLHHLSLHPI